MAFSELSSGQLSRLVQLVRVKEELQKQIADINRRLSTFESTGQTEPKTIGARRRRVRRGTMGKAILKQLTHAGKAGVSVKEIATATGAKAQSVAVWIYTTGTKIKGLRKVARGRFAYKPEA